MTTFSGQGSKKTGVDAGESRLQNDARDLKRDASAVKEDLQALKKDATAMATHAKDEAMEAVRCGAHSVSDMARNVSDTATHYHERLRDNVTARPMTSILLALGVGVIAGRLLARR